MTPIVAPSKRFDLSTARRAVRNRTECSLDALRSASSSIIRFLTGNNGVVQHMPTNTHVVRNPAVPYEKVTVSGLEYLSDAFVRWSIRTAYSCAAELGEVDMVSSSLKSFEVCDKVELS